VKTCALPDYRHCLPSAGATTIIYAPREQLTTPAAMSRKFFKKYMPDPHTIRHHKTLKIFGDLLHDPNLWHLNRHSVSVAFGIGLFFAWMPIPMQMLPAAACAILWRANLPISVSLVWITNPFTMAPLFYFAYLVGNLVLGAPEIAFAFEPSISWLKHELLIIWKPFLTGTFIVAVVSSAAGYFIIQLLWRYSVLKRHNQRRQRG
jgi:uncharacterized protein (DUF2062 family)